MVPDGFIYAGTLVEIAPGRRKYIYIDEERQLAIFNIDGTIYAVTNICPHQHSPAIVDGPVEDCTVTCPLHGWVYDLRTGRALGGGAKLRTFRVVIEGEEIWVEEPPDEEPSWAKGL